MTQQTDIIDLLRLTAERRASDLLLTVGLPPIEGDRGHSAALMKDAKSSVERTSDCTPGAAYSCTCVSVVKLWMGDSTSRTGLM